MKLKNQCKIECPSCEEGYIFLTEETFCDELPCDFCGESLNVNQLLQDIAEEFLQDGF